MTTETDTHTHTYTHTQIHTHTLSLTHTHRHQLLYTDSKCNSNTHTNSLSLSHTHTDIICYIPTANADSKCPHSMQFKQPPRRTSAIIYPHRLLFNLPPRELITQPHGQPKSANLRDSSSAHARAVSRACCLSHTLRHVLPLAHTATYIPWPSVLVIRDQE